MVTWTPEALQDRIDIWDYIAADNPGAAAKMDKLFSGAAADLGVHPELGKAGKVPATRELLPHESYRLVYEVADDTVWNPYVSPHRPPVTAPEGLGGVLEASFYPLALPLP